MGEGEEMSDDSLEQPPTIKPVPSIATDSAYPARIWPEYEVCPCCGTLLGEAVVRKDEETGATEILNYVQGELLPQLWTKQALKEERSGR